MPENQKRPPYRRRPSRAYRNEMTGAPNVVLKNGAALFERDGAQVQTTKAKGGTP